jgi:hypothetical protein
LSSDIEWSVEGHSAGHFEPDFYFFSPETKNRKSYQKGACKCPGVDRPKLSRWPLAVQGKGGHGRVQAGEGGQVKVVTMVTMPTVRLKVFGAFEK